MQLHLDSVLEIYRFKEKKNKATYNSRNVSNKRFTFCMLHKGEKGQGRLTTTKLITHTWVYSSDGTRIAKRKIITPAQEHVVDSLFAV